MGVVFLARDTRLGRSVALKSLPDDVAADPERLQRFEREARLLASLNHPNVATIYGVEVADGRRYLALEYIEGESLAARLARGALPLEETLEIGVQIAAGLEAAHEAGIIHRDLKPANVVITSGDRVKVIDFGLAKGRVSEEDGAGSPARVPGPVTPSSPTITIPPDQSPTMPGVILGTAPYLSPEQARGKPVDRRTDIWSFGCVLYECLTGTRAFPGGTTTDTIAAILRGEVEWSKLPAQTPAAVLALLARCLVKDPRRRLRDIGEARLALEDVRAGEGAVKASAAAGGAGPVPATASAEPGRPWYRRLRLHSLVAGVIGFLFAAAFWNLVLNRGARTTPRDVTRFELPAPPGVRPVQADLTADGRTLVLLGQTQPKDNSPGRRQLYIRRMDRPGFEPLRGTDRAAWFTLSANGKSIGFIAAISDRSTDGHLYVMPSDGSAPPVTLSPWELGNYGKPALLESGEALASVRGKQLVRIPKGGGAPDPPRNFNGPGYVEYYDMASPLPGDRGVLLTVAWHERSAYHQGIGVLDLKSGRAEILIREGGSPRYSATGHLLFTRGDALLAAPFDPAGLKLKGSPVALAGGLRSGTSGHAAFAFASQAGTMLTASGEKMGQGRHAVVIGKDGRLTEWSKEKRPFESVVRASPDGRRFAAITANASSNLSEIWVSERGSFSRRLIAVAGVDCDAPLWSPDGRDLAFWHFANTDTDGVYLVGRDARAAPRRIATMAGSALIAPFSWSPDGSRILVTAQREGTIDIGILKVPMPGEPPGSVQYLFPPGANRLFGRFSPDGRLIAYNSDETGRSVYVCEVHPDGSHGDPIVISSGAVNPGVWWSPDGRRLYYSQAPNIMSVSVTRSPSLAVSAPRTVLNEDTLRVVISQNGLALLDVLPDGSFLAILEGEEDAPIDRFLVTLNFDEEVLGKVTGRRGAR